MVEKAILFDTTKCMACRACQVACKQWNGLDAEKTRNRGSYENPVDISPDTWIKMKFIEVGREGDKVDWLFMRRACLHCTEAPCAKVCPTGALYSHEMGFVAYEKELCSGCGYCTEFCPFDTPRLRGSGVTGISKAEKCTMCQDRVVNGLEPACVKTCPPNALTFGNRDELIVAGKQRVQQIKRDFPNASLYGEKELGGLHVLNVLTEAPEVYGLLAKPEVPAAAIAWKSVIQPVGAVVIGLTVVGLGLNYLVARATVKNEAEEDRLFASKK
ncbi:MAG: 4Fe-4S dicluster domain-containing protein [Chloroflexi bacterium]|nr:4Fe-4S dicluster domain-containing protein [Chloroflexota bacterium]